MRISCRRRCRPWAQGTAIEVITADPQQFLAAWSKLPERPQQACARGVMMVLPEQFSVDPESALDNRYLQLEQAADPDLALRQAQRLAAAVEAVGVPVTCFPGRADQRDGLFPNNVFATAPGRCVVGRMLHPGRRPEAARRDIRRWLEAQGYRLHDLSTGTAVTELTGPLVIDRARQAAFCGMSQRMDGAGLTATHAALGLELTFRFALSPGEYHTNVVLSVLAGRACVAVPDAFPDPAVLRLLEAAYPQRCLSLDLAEKDAFAGNCIALTPHDLFLSERAADHLRPTSRQRLEAWGFRLHAVDLSEPERAGGSLRCMLAELF